LDKDAREYRTWARDIWTTETRDKINKGTRCEEGQKRKV